ncbi:Germin-like protein 5-1 [Platanthera zijinensis]|uniref:Germin-like protein n=1 Tax=Platanthera zijinensis TaxID=2320716 RepID=A0AAP0FVB2_9ASPA
MNERKTGASNSQRSFVSKRGLWGLPYIFLLPATSPLIPTTTSNQQQNRPTINQSPPMAPTTLLPLLLLLLLASAVATFAADPDPLQDLCVADLKSSDRSGVKVNGFVCKDAASVTAEDFFFKGLAAPAATNNSLGSVVTAANVEKIPGLNTLGVSLSRIDYAPGGLNPPHTHPRATEIVFVLYGALDVGFITTANKLVTKTIAQGENFVFPRGLVHFQKNNDGDKPAAVIAAFNSQLPGTQGIAAALFSASPPVPDNVLTKAFQIGTKEVEKIKSRFAPKT